MKTTIEKLEKARRSLVNYVARGGRNTCQRGYDLIDRYSDLRDDAMKEGVWKEYCERYDYSIFHDAYDFFA